MNNNSNSFPEIPIAPTNIGMHQNYYDDIIYQPAIPYQSFPDRKNRRPLPRRHTVSTPYDTNMVNNNQQVKVKEPIPTTTTTTTTTTAVDIPVIPQPQQKTRKSSLKAKRHRSMGKLDSYATPSSVSPPPIPSYEPLSAKLELWTHEQLLERVMELEKERQVSQNLLNKPNKGNNSIV
jgi:hypothetical protein